MTPEEALGIRKLATEETLQSIDSTLKRIEKALIENQTISIDPKVFSKTLVDRLLKCQDS